MRIKFIFESIVIFFFVALVFESTTESLAVTNKFVDLIHDYDSLDDKVNSGNYTGTELQNFEAQRLTTRDDLNHFSRIFFTRIYNIIYSIYLTLPLILKNWSQIIFANIRNKNKSVLSGEMFLSYVTAILTIYLSYGFFYYYRVGLDTSSQYFYFDMALRFADDDTIHTDITFPILLGSIMCRIFYLLKAGRTFGPMVEILSSMLKQLFIFLTLM